MKTLAQRRCLLLVVTLATGICSLDADPVNRPPSVAILYPKQGEDFSNELIKFKAAAEDPDGQVVEVRFFADNKMVATVTNPPFAIIWQMPLDDFRSVPLKVVAVDNLGATTESPPLGVFQVFGQPPVTTLEITSPRNGAVFAAPATFTFAAELLAVYGDARVEFLVGTNSLAIIQTELSATALPVSITVSNLSEGEYKLKVRDRENGICRCGERIIRVAKLAVQSPRLTTDHRFQFEVLTSFPGVETVIQASPDLLGWTPINTNRPATNTFVFTDTSPATNRYRFYRVVLPSQP